MQIRPTGLPGSKIMLVQEEPRYDEVQSGTPFSGNAGRFLDGCLHDSGLSRNNLFCTSFMRVRSSAEATVAQKKADITPLHEPFGSKMVLPGFIAARNFLLREIEMIRPRVVMPMGNAAMFALTGQWGMRSWRGSQSVLTTPNGHRCYVLPSYAPDFVQAVYKERGNLVMDLRRAKTLSQHAEVKPEPEYRFLIRPGFADAAACLQQLLTLAEVGPLLLSEDIETRAGHIACIGLAWSKLDAICIPLMHHGVQSYWMEHEETFLMHLLYRLTTHPNVEIIGQNFIYDAQYIHRHFHYVPRFKRDTMIAHHSIYSSLPKGLDYLASFYCETYTYWKAESKNWDPKIGEDQLWSYNCKDCVYTFEIDEKEQSAIQGLLPTWPELQAIHDFQQLLFWPVLNSMLLGINVNHESRANLSKEIGEALEERQIWLESVIGRPVNIRSPKQMADFFYRELAQKKISKRGSDAPTTDDAALEKIGKREPILQPIVDTISDLRSLGVFKSTFVDAALDRDARMRCSFNICGTLGYRFSSSQNAFDSGMNLQNIPVGDEEGQASSLKMPNIRKLFITDPEMIFFDIDLDSADLRIVVEEGNVSEMRQWLLDGKKPYVEVAKEYYRDSTITKSHPAYKFFKSFCHATHYMGTPDGMADKVNQHARMAGLPSFSVAELERLQNWYFGKFPEIKNWHKKITEQLFSKRFIQNIFGYRVYFFDRIDKHVLNQAVALIPQSTIACLINRGYMNLFKNEPEIQVLLQVHDSLAGQFPTSMVDAQERIIRQCTIPLPYPKPLIIPVGIKSSPISWGHCS